MHIGIFVQTKIIGWEQSNKRSQFLPLVKHCCLIGSPGKARHQAFPHLKAKSFKRDPSCLSIWFHIYIIHLSSPVVDRSPPEILWPPSPSKQPEWRVAALALPLVAVVLFLKHRLGAPLKSGSVSGQLLSKICWSYHGRCSKACQQGSSNPIPLQSWLLGRQELLQAGVDCQVEGWVGRIPQQGGHQPRGQPPQPLALGQPLQGLAKPLLPICAPCLPPSLHHCDRNEEGAGSDPRQSANYERLRCSKSFTPCSLVEEEEVDADPGHCSPKWGGHSCPKARHTTFTHNGTYLHDNKDMNIYGSG